ncbi:MAG: endolytic transglycosylase MltG [Candidatus Tectomicrobia bacterium]
MNSAKRGGVKRLGAALGTVLLLGSLATFYLWLYYHTPAAREAEAQVVSIAPGTHLYQIATELEQAGLIRHRWMFVVYVSRLHPGPHLQAGEYTLRATMSPVQIAAILRSGKVKQHVLTIPEGANLRDIAAAIAVKGLGDSQVILNLTHDAAFIASLGLSTPSLEGYLFPDTYYLSRHMGERALLTHMVQTLHKNYTDAIAAQGHRLGLTQHAALTLASLIEKEAQVDEERPVIAAVYHNRLRRGMRLQCDPTVIYALGERFDGNLRKRDLRIDSPYNTYRYAGLPPGPIASAGRRSIEAAVSPAATDYLYFVATGDNGRHKFSTTLREHNRAVHKYQVRQ